MTQPLISIRTGHTMGEWLHEYFINDIVDELNHCCAYDLLPATEYDLLYGTADTVQGRRIVGIYKMLGPHLTEVWNEVAKLGSLSLGVEAIFRKYFGRPSGIQWNSIRSYKAIKGQCHW